MHEERHRVHVGMPVWTARMKNVGHRQSCHARVDSKLRSAYQRHLGPSGSMVAAMSSASSLRRRVVAAGGQSQWMHVKHDIYRNRAQSTQRERRGNASVERAWTAHRLRFEVVLSLLRTQKRLPSSRTPARSAIGPCSAVLGWYSSALHPGTQPNHIANLHTRKEVMNPSGKYTIR
eukprot:COSAG05_NODE_5130_length_1257_cov_1.153713_1_plen_176_part_00